MTPTSDPSAPADTTDDPELEEKWQALVRGVIEAKAVAAEKRQAWAEACVARGPIHVATDEATAAAKRARAEYEAAAEAVRAAGELLKAGEL